MKNTIFTFLFCFCSLSFFAQDLVVQSHQKISDTQGGFTGILDDGDVMGNNLENIGDLDKDGIDDLAVSAIADDDGGSNKGAVWILFMKADGTVKSHQKISDTQGGFTGILSLGDNFGRGISGIGDLDKDGVLDIAVGADFHDDGGSNKGAVWILFLNTDGTVKSHQKISDTQGNFMGVLSINDRFGRDITPLEDMDGDNIIDIAITAHTDNDGGLDRGAVWILFMNTNGTVKGHQKISDTQGNFQGMLGNADRFGTAVDFLGDLDKDGIGDIIVGAVFDDEMGNDAGTAWVLFLNSNGTVKGHQKITQLTGNFLGQPENGDNFGVTLSAIGDINGDNIMDVAVGAWKDADGGTGKGATWILALNTDGTIKCTWKISDLSGNFTGTIDGGDGFGVGVSMLGDLDNDGFSSIAIGARGDDDGGTDRGAVWVLELDYTDYSDILGEDTIICFDGTYLIDATIPNNATYYWQDGSTQPTLLTGVSGWYWVNITLSNGCSVTDSIHVFFTQGPNIEFGSDTIFLQAGTSIVLDAGTSGTNYIWNTGDTSQTITVTQSGIYHVVVSNASGCNDEDEVVVIILTNTEEITKNVAFELYPNPAKDKMTLDFKNSSNSTILSYQIVDNLGRVVQKGTVHNSSMMIDIVPLSSGIYYFQIIENDKPIGVKQFIKK